MIIDMHVDARSRDGNSQEPRHVFEQARKAGLDGVLVIGAETSDERTRWLEARGDKDARVFFATEIATTHARFVCVPTDPEAPGIPAAWLSGGAAPPAEGDVLERLNESGAAIIVSQPYDRELSPTPADLVFAFEGIHAVEVRTTATSPFDADLAQEAARGMRLPCVAGAGPGAAPRDVGQLATVFLSDAATQEELVRALRGGDLWPMELEQPRGPSSSRKKRRRRKKKPQGEGNATAEG